MDRRCRGKRGGCVCKLCLSWGSCVCVGSQHRKGERIIVGYCSKQCCQVKVVRKELLYVLSVELCVVRFMFLWCRWWGLCCCRVFSIDFFKAC